MEAETILVNCVEQSKFEGESECTLTEEKASFMLENVPSQTASNGSQKDVVERQLDEKSDFTEICVEKTDSKNRPSEAEVVTQSTSSRQTCSQLPSLHLGSEEIEDSNDHRSCTSDSVEVGSDHFDCRTNANTVSIALTSSMEKHLNDENEAPQNPTIETDEADSSTMDSSSPDSSFDTSEVVCIEEEEKSEQVSQTRLAGKCQVCCSCSARYTCPRCEIRTCSVPCVKQHKTHSGCSGERDKLAFVEMSQYTDHHLFNDYKFLEDAERRLFSNTTVPSSHRRQAVRYTPYQMSKRCKYLMNAAYKRGIHLRFVHPALSKNKSNSSFFTIRVPETTVLIEAARKFLNFTDYPHLRKSLQDYRGEKLNSCHFLLKVDGLPANMHRYFALKPELSLSENLKGVCLTEYPTITVVSPSDQLAVESYLILSKDDMPSMDRDSARHILHHHPHLNPAGDAEKQLLDINSSLYTASQKNKAA
ncbi:Box c/d snorna protein 1-like [Plakobranchus ocellatus]|uniref:Box c/d snorna protein 1-like n=1 Tax=Plakobranchus ocellatus TaxID=259542 RepID=A0AAV4AK71_9GAST|nr:Box c/d snorna protein 1-like [Plakobranchus ocellatus]